MSKKKVVFKTKKIELSTLDGTDLKKRIFFKNDEVLKKEDDNDYSEDDFRQLVSSECQKKIIQKFDNIVVLFGAGASVTNNEYKKNDDGISKSGVTVTKLATIVLKELESKKYMLEKEVDVYTLPEISKKCKYSDNIIIKEKLSDSFNLENLLSYIFSYEKFLPNTDKIFINTKNAILDIIIKATSYDYNENIFQHVSLLKIFSNIITSENKLNIVTTNYDTLIEEAAEKMKWTVFDGFSFSQQPQFDRTMFDWNLVKDVPYVKTNEKIYKKNVINLLKIHGSLTWEFSEDESKIYRKSKKDIKKPIMVFPSSDKYAQSYQQPYFDLFNKFQNILQLPNTLLMTIGFSFADNHIARMIINAIQTNDSLTSIITDYNLETKNKNWEELEQLMISYYDVSFVGTSLNGELTEYLGGSDYENRSVL